MSATLEPPPSSDAAKRPQPRPDREAPPKHSWTTLSGLWRRKTTIIAALAIAGIAAHLVLRFGFRTAPGAYGIPLLATLVIGGLPLLYDLLRKLLKREFGSDLLGGISIVTSALLGEYLAGSIIVLMLAGGEALESYALRSASSVLAALAKRMPSVAHRKHDSEIVDVALPDVAVGDTLVIYPHDICPVDGVVIEGHGVMDESYLTGEPFEITKTSGSTVISGAINGESALTIRTTQRAADSRYAKIMEVMRESESKRPQLQRLGDQLGAIYTPVALAVAIIAWVISGESVRFLAVLVIATPCPLLIGIPIAIIGSISLCARRAIIVKMGIVFGLNEEVIKGRLENSAAAVRETLYQADDGAIKAVLGKSWPQMQRAHLHAGAMGTIALALIVLVSLLGASRWVTTAIGVGLGAGGLGYSLFWMWAGFRAPGLGSTGAAKESLKWLAMPSSGAFVLATLPALILLIVTIVRRQPANS